MKQNIVGSLAALVLSGVGCSSPVSPAQPTGSAAPLDSDDLTASVTVPRALSPAVAAQIGNLDQPVTLVVANAVITQSTTVIYTFEVATDTTFANKVYSKSGVAAGSNGQTSLTIDRLGAGADYGYRKSASSSGSW